VDLGSRCTLKKLVHEACASKKAIPVTVVATGEFAVVHQKIAKFKRNAWEAENISIACAADMLVTKRTYSSLNSVVSSIVRSSPQHQCRTFMSQLVRRVALKF
jgi:hypothetical protein